MCPLQGNLTGRLGMSPSPTLPRSSCPGTMLGPRAPGGRVPGVLGVAPPLSHSRGPGVAPGMFPETPPACSRRPRCPELRAIEAGLRGRAPGTVP